MLRSFPLFAFALLAARACPLAFMTRRLTPNKHSFTLLCLFSPPLLVHQSKLLSDDKVNFYRSQNHQCLAASASSALPLRARQSDLPPFPRIPPQLSPFPTMKQRRLQHLGPANQPPTHIRLHQPTLPCSRTCQTPSPMEVLGPTSLRKPKRNSNRPLLSPLKFLPTSLAIYLEPCALHARAKKRAFTEFTISR